MTMNTTWGYSDHDHAWKSDEALVRNLIDVASKGGNYLLNIGPKGDGSIPEESVRSMRAIGRWMKTNAESIYGTRASEFANLPWGRSTTKGKTRYFHVFDWPADGRLVVPGLTSKVRSARLLGGGPLKTESGAAGLVINLPGRSMDPIASVVAVEVR
jgi:alpha-L-fucosidase